MKITNQRPDEREIPDVGIVEGGGDIEVPDELGKSLCEQPDNWKPAKSTTKKED